MPHHNLEGLPEGKLKVRRRAEKGATRKYKKRHRKELTIAMQSEIVRLYTEEHMLQREIAQRFKVAPALVGGLVREAVRQPEK